MYTSKLMLLGLVMIAGVVRGSEKKESRPIGFSGAGQSRVTPSTQGEQDYLRKFLVTEATRVHVLKDNLMQGQFSLMAQCEQYKQEISELKAQNSKLLAQVQELTQKLQQRH